NILDLIFHKPNMILPPILPSLNFTAELPPPESNQEL
ncbi:hypothetical protein A2U01_0119603, partial [Trifolium medium]|nr:hypothetical protein [Trifolium medium]